MKAGWTKARLGDLCNKITDGSHNPPKGVEFSEYLMLSSKNIFDDSINLDNPRYLTEDNFISENKRTTTEVGDVLLTIVGTIGRTAVVHSGLPKFTLQRSVAVLKNKPEIIQSRFLMLSLQNILDELTENARGVAQKGLYLGQINDLEISVPSLLEQQRIVTILDEAFEGIATATANAEMNLSNARSVFDSYLQAMFADNDEAWEKHTLKGVALTFGRGKSRHRPRNEPKLYGGNYPFIQTGDIRNSDHFITEYSQTYNEVGLAQSKLWSKGKLCITIAANIAETGILGFDSCFPDSVIEFVADPKKSDVHFVEYLLSSFKARLKAKGKGSAQDNLNLASFENERFPFPPLDQQKSIVAILDDLSAEVSKLESVYQQKLDALAELKKSILHQAFSGQLQ